MRSIGHSWGDSGDAAAAAGVGTGGSAPGAAGTLDEGIVRAREALKARQRADGSWNTLTDIGPVGLATQILVEKLLGAFPVDDEVLAQRWFAEQQHPDGSFPAHPGGVVGSVTATALSWAALVACRASEDNIARRAKSYLDAHGGWEAVTRAFRERGDVAALYLLPHGHVDAAFLPRLPPGSTLAPIVGLRGRRAPHDPTQSVIR